MLDTRNKDYILGLAHYPSSNIHSYPKSPKLQQIGDAVQRNKTMAFVEWASQSKLVIQR